MSIRIGRATTAAQTTYLGALQGAPQKPRTRSVQAQSAPSRDAKGPSAAAPTPAPGPAAVPTQSTIPTQAGAGQVLASIMHGARAVAVAAVIAGAAVGLTGCGQAPEPSPGFDVSISLREGIQVKGESPSHAEFRIKAHTLANEDYLGSKWAMYAHSAGTDLSMDRSELLALMDASGADVRNLEALRGANLASELLRMLNDAAGPQEVKARWAERIIETQDANKDGKLSWAEFAPLLEIPKP